MIKGFSAIPSSRNVRCDVCDSVLSTQDLLRTQEAGCTICRAFDCQGVMRQKKVLPPALFDAYLNFNKKLIFQRRQDEAARRRHIDEVLDREGQDHNRIHQSFLESHPDFSKENVYLAVIPTGCSTLTPAPRKRLDNYIAHLQRVVSEAGRLACVADTVYDDHRDAHEKRQRLERVFVDNPSLRNISDRLCGMCKGGCCVSAKDHAYLSVFSIRQYMDDHPELTAEDVLALYLSKLPAETIEHSCINHGRTGCVLPRELRSDICNGYYCDSIKSYHKQVRENKSPGRVLAVQRAYTDRSRFRPGVNNEIRCVALVGPKRSEELDIRPVKT